MSLKILSITQNLQRLLLGSIALAINLSHAQESISLLQSFQSPPKETRPTVWWRFMDDHVSREGIAADLDFMKRAGLSGGIVSFCSSSTKLSERKAGSTQVPILSKDWWNIMGYQLDAANKRDLNLWFQASPGYATSGGPWIPPEHSMQKLVWKEVTCEAAKGFDGILPLPAVDKRWNHYRDIAVLAYPEGKTPVAPEKVIDLTKLMEASGRLKWKPATGTWRIVRLGHTTTGKTVHPTMPTGTGLECDKLSRDATRIQFEVKNLARITVNGTTFPELWKPPFTCDITTAAKPGANSISVEVVNLWVNRLIGDEQEPPDIQWGAPQYNPAKLYKGQPIEAVPEWLLRGTPRPSSGRRTFTTWNYIKKDQALLPSGLLGPVSIITTIESK